jgi:hypothetical protein
MWKPSKWTRQGQAISGHSEEDLPVGLLEANLAVEFPKAGPVAERPHKSPAVALPDQRLRIDLVGARPVGKGRYHLARRR